jgi:hypothetical protein
VNVEKLRCFIPVVPPAPANVDINGDGAINIKDAAIIVPTGKNTPNVFF